MNKHIPRRQFLRSAGAALAAGAVLPGAARAAPAPAPALTGDLKGRIFKSIKFGMFAENIPLREKFQLLKDMGYDGVELNSPGGENKKEALEASQAAGLPIHGVVDSIHWDVRLSHPDPAVRARGLEGLKTAIEETRLVGGSAVLLVPGAVRDQASENQDQVWERSIDGIRQALPLAARRGVRILIENVWNGFCYVHDGPEDQTADLLARYLDAIDSPWVGSYFDIGNHQRYGKPEQWIRTLGRRIVKLDVKDWGKKNGFCAIGDGDVNWPEVRKSLLEIGFTGWATAEVEGGDRKQIARIAAQMDRVLGL